MTAVSVIAAIIVGAGIGVIFIMLFSQLLMTFVLTLRDEGNDTVSAPKARASSKADILDIPAFRRITDGLDAPILITENGTILSANPSALTLLGTHILGEDVRIAIRHPAAAERLTSSETLESAVTIDIVGIGARAQRWSMQIIPLDQNSGQQRLFVYLDDKTNLHAAERSRGDFVANASHELRTPLAAILGFVETLQDANAGGDTPTRTRFLSIIENEARRMRQLVDDLMSLSRIEADKHRLPTELISLPDLISEVVGVARQNLDKRGADIAITPNKDLPPIMGDRTQIGQLLHNLINNSAKYGRPGTPITIRTEAMDPNMVRLEVSDEGEGIPSDHLPRLTERFYRVDSGRSRTLGGTGLGLAIVKHIVERHRGRLDISSQVGKGTRISVLLPQADLITPQQKDTDDRVTAPMS